MLVHFSSWNWTMVPHFNHRSDSVSYLYLAHSKYVSHHRTYLLFLFYDSLSAIFLYFCVSLFYAELHHPNFTIDMIIIQPQLFLTYHFLTLQYSLCTIIPCLSSSYFTMIYSPFSTYIFTATTIPLISHFQQRNQNHYYPIFCLMWIFSRSQRFFILLFFPVTGNAQLFRIMSTSI